MESSPRRGDGEGRDRLDEAMRSLVREYSASAGRRGLTPYYL
jgi:hypothetical protein